MRTETAVPLDQITQPAAHARADRAASQVFVEREFLLDPFSLRAQFDWKVARKGLSAVVQPGLTTGGVPAIFRSSPEQIFTHEIMIDLLNQVRKAARTRLHASHASTPQIAAFQEGSHTWVEQDATVAPWRYMYFLGPRHGTPSMVVTISMREAIFKWFAGLTRTSSATTCVASNDLILYRSTAVQSLRSEAATNILNDQILVFSGWL